MRLGKEPDFYPAFRLRKRPMIPLASWVSFRDFSTACFADSTVSEERLMRSKLAFSNVGEASGGFCLRTIITAGTVAEFRLRSKGRSNTTLRLLRACLLLDWLLQHFFRGVFKEIAEDACVMPADLRFFAEAAGQTKTPVLKGAAG